MTFEEHSEVRPVNGEIFKAIERENPLNAILILHVQKIKMFAEECIGLSLR